ncbi:NAD(P) transhydrogenase subunit alpha [Arenicella chitinivorans]|uniref:NAD(P) transhydrogenase subunit alpha n=1 Tax=Arenicella chitinivorans TaxID=1329800 RepID=A0A918RXI6_9GAMM|nr:Re/Si-specific NAD(P)(+) transhydrogenase subunit alpha [Arenicella chitinivorans]GHA12493.1 NAD(P) transhydrogenase subunit alpha [Arenicella chitinivorans]
MIISIPKESFKGEKRVALTPESATQILKLGHTLRIETGAGKNAEFSDADYKDAGVDVVPADAIWTDTDIIMKVRGVTEEEAGKLTAGTTVISFFWPAQNEALLKKLADAKVNVIAMDCVPRLSRSQKMDALSSMANIGGYRAVVEAANLFGRFFTGQVTAAGKVPPAKVLVIGAGVAGLAAIGAAKSMGAIVRAFDTRLEAKEQVESLGGEFLVLEFEEDGSGEGGYAKTMSKEFIDAEMAMFREQAKEVDIIITTALIPGKPAPELITKDMVESMKSGSVIVDLAAEQGGNCKLSKANKVVTHKGVKIIGYTDLPSRLATQSSQLYATNLRHMLTDLTPEKDGQVVINMEDDVIRGATAAHAGKVTWPAPAPKLSAAPKPPPKPAAAPPAPAPEMSAASKAKMTFGAMALGVLALLGVGSVAPPDFMSHFTVFVLACFVGYQVIWSVTPSLHTPLMSVTNAISGIIVVGALLQISSGSGLVVFLAFIAILIASINIAGGFLVTQRMLKMFNKG